MPQSSYRTPISTIIALAVVLSLSVGCAGMWKRVRENERTNAVSNSRTFSKNGRCSRALASLDRAEAKLEIGPFGQEATVLRIRCYERQERWAVARAHQRLLEDFYAQDNPSYPVADGSSVFRVSKLPKIDFEKPPEALEMKSPVYSEPARRSYITGRVVISFKLGVDNRAKAIRVLEMPHPLLATWAIEAIERTEKKRKFRDTLLAPGGHYIATYSFQYRWAEEGLGLDGAVEEFSEGI